MLLLALVWWDNLNAPEQAEEGQPHALSWSIQISAAHELNSVDQHQERTRPQLMTQPSHCCSAWDTLALDGHQVKSVAPVLGLRLCLPQVHSPGSSLPFTCAGRFVTAHHAVICLAAFEYVFVNICI